jgi:hypothetical protein
MPFWYPFLSFCFCFDAFPFLRHSAFLFLHHVHLYSWVTMAFLSFGLGYPTQASRAGFSIFFGWIGLEYMANTHTLFGDCPFWQHDRTLFSLFSSSPLLVDVHSECSHKGCLHAPASISSCAGRLGIGGIRFLCSALLGLLSSEVIICFPHGTLRLL